ncbi:hypothetical protein QBC40DRAFT_252237 [Triangularia verruculosa]|uniref:Uncharacterized protein n=1 Tax=Triangularia verruculosa TaxID=2587418 RepID=A0AAN6XRA3_9PEZI|nr:hypothetical protein QBC40DRAFT_252237 [Triangularia verruculosa]
MSNQKKTYFLCPNWDFHPSSLRLGSLITSKEKPDYALNESNSPWPLPYNPSPNPLGNSASASSAPAPSTPNSILPPTTKYNTTWSTASYKSGKYALYTEFISMLTGLGANLEIDHFSSTSNVFHFRELVTEQFVPTQAYFQACIDASESARDFITLSWFKKHLYMVTSVKIARGASARVLTAKGQGTEAGVSVDGSLFMGGGAPGSVGPEVSSGKGHSERGTFEGASDFVFAFGLHRVVVRRAGKGEAGASVQVVGAPMSYTSGAMYGSDRGPARDLDAIVVDGVASGEASASDFEGSEGKLVMDVDGEEVVCVRPV